MNQKTVILSCSSLKDYVEAAEQDEQVRPLVPKTIKEFLVPPIIYIKVELYDAYTQIVDKLPAHEYRDAAKGKQSFEIEFASIDDRDAAREVLDSRAEWKAAEQRRRAKETEREQESTPRGGFFSGLFGGRDDDKPRKNQPPEF